VSDTGQAGVMSAGVPCPFVSAILHHVLVAAYRIRRQGRKDYWSRLLADLPAKLVCLFVTERIMRRYDVNTLRRYGVIKFFEA
jgi:hypothetical protein